ncbi:MAG: Fic family protein [Candidatus Micrarchaeota archaeon]
MVSKYDLLYSVFLNEGLTTAQLVRKLGKTAAEYDSFHKHLQTLLEDGLVTLNQKQYFVAKNEAAKKFLRVIDFCVRDGINYNELFLDLTIEFIEFGLKNKLDSELPFDYKTVARISVFLAKHGFILIDSRKPFSARVVCPHYLETVVELFREKAEVKSAPVYEGADEENLNNQIEREFSTFKKTSKPVNIDDEIRFIHRSLSLEGNTTTLSETERLIKENTPPKTRTFQEMQEITNYKKALDIFIREPKGLDLRSVLEFHEKAMGTLEAGAGQLRMQNVKIKGNPEFKTADWKEVPRRLDDLFEYYKQNAYKKMKPHETVELAAYLHNEFQRIHPFIDGNSRTSRALFVHTLLLKGFPLITFPAGFIEPYMNLTKLSKERNDKNFTTLMKQLVLHSLRQTNQKMKYA